jgi:hypothetical protein
LLTDDEARDLVNVQGTTAGAIVKRRGLVTFASSTNPLGSLRSFEATGTPFLVGGDGSKLISVTASGGVSTIGTGFTGSSWEFAEAPIVSGQGPLYATNGVDTPQQWDGSAGTTTAWTNATGSVGVPNGKYCLTYQNRVFITGVASNPSRVYWSAIADPTNWDPASLIGAGFMDFDPNDGAGISAIGHVGPYLLVAKPSKSWILYDVDNASARVLSANVGVIAHRSIAVGPEGTYFLAEDRGVFLTNGSKLTPLTDKIQPTIDSIEPTLKSSAAGAYFGGHYYLSVTMKPQAPTGATATLYGGPGVYAVDGTYGDSAIPSARSNDTTLDWDATLGSWWKHSFGSNQFTVWRPTGAASLFSAKGSAAIIDQCFVPGVTVDNGVPFMWEWAGPWQSPTFYRRRRFPTPYFKKRLRQIRIDGAGTVDFSMGRDFTSGEALIKADLFASSTTGGLYGGTGTFGVDGIYGDASTISRARVYSLGVANAFSLVFSSTSTTEDVILAYVLMITDRKDLVTS